MRFIEAAVRDLSVSEGRLRWLLYGRVSHRERDFVDAVSVLQQLHHRRYALEKQLAGEQTT